jgi:predicted DNA-binding protein
MRFQKVALPDLMFERAKALASRLEMTFTALVRQAISEFLEKHGA